MASFNKVMLMGNLTRDPEIKFTPKGNAVAKLGLAVNRKWKSETGEAKEEVTFIDVDVFGKSAETIAQYVKKGAPIFIEGRLKLDTWDDKQTGQKRQKLGVVLESFQFLGKSEGGTAAAPTGETRHASAPTRSAPPAENAAPSPDDDDSVPF